MSTGKNIHRAPAVTKIQREGYYAKACSNADFAHALFAGDLKREHKRNLQSLAWLIPPGDDGHHHIYMSQKTMAEKLEYGHRNSIGPMLDAAVAGGHLIYTGKKYGGKYGPFIYTLSRPVVESELPEAKAMTKKAAQRKPRAVEKETAPADVSAEEWATVAKHAEFMRECLDDDVMVPLDFAYQGDAAYRSLYRRAVYKKMSAWGQDRDYRASDRMFRELERAHAAGGIEQVQAVLRGWLA